MEEEEGVGVRGGGRCGCACVKSKGLAHPHIGARRCGQTSRVHVLAAWGVVPPGPEGLHAELAGVRHAGRQEGQCAVCSEDRGGVCGVGGLGGGNVLRAEGLLLSERMINDEC
jgi:hypothetical protein